MFNFISFKTHLTYLKAGLLYHPKLYTIGVSGLPKHNFRVVQDVELV